MNFTIAHQISLNLTKSHHISLNRTKSHWFLPNFTISHQISAYRTKTKCQSRTSCVTIERAGAGGMFFSRKNAAIFIYFHRCILRLRKSNAKHDRPGGCHLCECWVNKNCVFHLYIVKIHLDNINKSYKTCEALGEAFRGKLWQKSASWKADFLEKKQTNWK